MFGAVDDRMLKRIHYLSTVTMTSASMKEIRIQSCRVEEIKVSVRYYRSECDAWILVFPRGFESQQFKNLHSFILSKYSHWQHKTQLSCSACGVNRNIEAPRDLLDPTKNDTGQALLAICPSCVMLLK